MLEIKYRLTSELIGYVNNSRTHSEEQVSQISASIKEFGFIVSQYWREFGIILLNNEKGPIMKNIADYPNYKITENGEVYSCRNRKIMKNKVSNGYSSVGLRKDGRYHYHNVHRLVLMAYGELPEDYQLMQACHNDGDKSNNHISNLRWSTPKENTNDKYAHGTAFKCPDGEAHHNSRLNVSMVVKMRIDAVLMNTKQIGIKYGVAKLTAYDAIVGNSWKSVNAIQLPVNLSGRQYNRL